MKIRKSITEGKERTVYIYENKKEEYFMIAIPDINWSIMFTYEQEMKENVQMTLEKRGIDEEESLIIANRIFQWTTEM
ncbi:YueH family protein [Rossellomorea sp. BNER]|uniref:YueH family protein n=1 Tax=Rossellomorea sp. BNER TaxID=2962031 RepID=UPI003AF27CFE|nr:YueH family protein [Rossellomorea sp. BNER]